MALTTSELTRLKYELGYPMLSTYAEPYISIVAVFDQVIQPYLMAGAVTTSSTAVSAATTPTLTSITLASATGFAAGASVVIDVDDHQEVVTVSSVSGSAISAYMTLAHSGTYTVTVEGGESIVRMFLRQLRALQDGNGSAGSAGAYAKALNASGIAEVDEIKFQKNGSGTGANQVLAGVVAVREELRRELALSIGVPYLRDIKRGAGSGGGGGRMAAF